MAISHVTSLGGGDTDADITVASVPSGTDRLYIVTGGTKHVTDVRITSISGGGLTWIDLQDQCSGRGNTMVDVWYAIGDAGGSFSITVTLTAAPSAAFVVIVDVFDGADPALPVRNAQGENTNGPDGACTGGSDNGTPNVQITIGDTGTSWAWVVTNFRNRTLVLDAEYTLRGDQSENTGGSEAHIKSATNDSPAASESADHTFSSGETDWSMVGLEIIAAAASAPRNPGAHGARLGHIF